jgi:hypothetical protein
MYTLAHPEHVKKLLALSPIGYSASILQGAERGEEELEAKYKGLDAHPTWFVQAGKLFWRNKLSPFSVARLLG